ncbi:MAG: carbohydrate kinase family protein [Spirochaetia bacterium]|jgi:sugar/nucleoside kinase (ribokinase family)
MKKVVFLGDCNVDLIMDGLEDDPGPDKEIGCASFHIAMGASSCIAAAAYASLGGDARVCGLCGDDEFGKLMREKLAAAGVRTDMVRCAASEKTGVTVNLVRGAARYQVTYPGAMVRFTLTDIPDALFHDLRHLHISGVYQTKALLPHVAGILARAADAGATTSLDCQWDPGERWEGLDSWLPRLSWLFANAQEARSMTGTNGTAEALRALADQTPCPVVKTGAEGARAIVNGRETLVPAAPVDVVDTIGAGDNFNAGFLFAVMEKDMHLLEAVRFANAAGGLSCTFRGGTDARSSWQDVCHFMEKQT